MSDYYAYTQTISQPQQAFHWIADPGYGSQPSISFSEAVDKVRTGDVKSLRVYLAENGNIHATDNNGWTLLHWAVKYRQLKVVADLIAFGADPEKPTRNGWTPLAIAVKNGSPAIIQFLGQIRKKA